MATQVLISSGTSWTVPADCISADSVECIGAGQGGNATNGGAGGDYAKATGIALTPGASVTIAIGAGGAGVSSGSQNAGGDTTFASSVLAKGGGSASTDIGSTTYAGGAGNSSGAGGGAAGPNGTGGAASGTTGGTGDNSAGGAGGTSGNAGSAGTEWTTAGSGGGGGAAGAALPAPTVVYANIGPYDSGSVGAFTVSAGNAIIVAFSVYTANGSQPSAGSFSDSKGNSYALVDTFYSGASTAGPSMTTFVYVCKSPAAGSTTVSWSSTWGPYPTCSVIVTNGQDAANPVETSGFSPYTSQPSPIAFSSGNITTSTANDLIIGLLGLAANDGWMPTAGSGFTLNKAVDSSNTTSAGIESAVQASLGSVAATFGCSNTGYTFDAAVCVALAIKP